MFALLQFGNWWELESELMPEIAWCKLEALSYSWQLSIDRVLLLLEELV